MQGSIYERLGGEAAITAAVECFYEKVVADETLAPFFVGLDVTAQSRKMVGFLAWAFGGPQEYRGRDLRSAHAGLRSRGLSDAHFDAIAGHLGSTMVELRIEDGLQKHVLNQVESLRGAVLGH